jgi:hypothetical protein
MYDLEGNQNLEIAQLQENNVWTSKQQEGQNCFKSQLQARSSAHETGHFIYNYF